jgi:hypothetical protein
LNAHIFRGFKEKLKLWWYELGNGKKCELDLNCKNGFSSTLFG